jgi:PKD repeat protein
MADGVAGYAFYPSAVQGIFAPYDGVMILSDYIGSIGTSSPGTSRALTHEIGHYLNLPHTWGSTNNPGVACGDDGIFDTPATKGWLSCNLNGSVCEPGVIENVQNYMEYAYCSNMFTAGQVQVMQGVLSNTVSDRNNLWSETNREATGTTDGYVSECAPRANFNPNHYFVCQGQDILFTDYSWGGEVTSWSWDIPGGNPSTSTAQSPVVIFDNPGKYMVTLTVSNSIGSNTISKEVYVGESVAPVTNLLQEGFEDATAFNNNWIIKNVDNNESEWSLHNGGGNASAHSLMMDNFHGDKGDVDYFVTPSMDLSALSQVYLSFDYAGATSTSNLDLINDQLRIFSSTNCGEQWIQRAVFDGLSLINNGAWGSPFSADGNSTWTVASVTLPTILTEPNVRFKFEFTGGYAGNNLFIDNINISQYPVGINSPVSEVTSLNIFPNPSNGDFLLTYNLAKEGKVVISVIDLTGREVSRIAAEQQAAGNHEKSIQKTELGNLSAGIYSVRLQSNGQSFVRKLVIE